MSDDRDLDTTGPLAQRYRALGGEEPPRALDEAILAEAKRSVRPWTQRWAVPLSLAAVVVLSVAVTLRIQYEQPDIDAPASPAREIAPAASAPRQQPPREPKPADVPKESAGRAMPETAAKSVARKEPSPFPSALRDKATVDKTAAATGVVAPPAVATAPAADLASRADQERRGPASALGAAAPSAPQPASSAPVSAKRLMAREEMQAETPERELERIALLRREGKHDEADKALAEFRKRRPDYRIPEAMLERVERR